MLIIRNRSGLPIKTVTLIAVDKRYSSGQRYGSISPVPMGASQVYVRPIPAPPLPAHLKMEWITGSDRRYTRVVPLSEALRDRTAGADALVFEIGPDQGVQVYKAVFTP